MALTLTRLTSAAPVTRKNRIWDLLLLTEPSQLPTPQLFSAAMTSFLSFPLPFPNLLCPLFWRRTFGEVATKLGAGTKFYHAERNRERSFSFLFHPAHSWWISGHYRLLLQSLCCSPVSTNIYTHATSISSLLQEDDGALLCGIYSTIYRDIYIYIYSTHWYGSKTKVPVPKLVHCSKVSGPLAISSLCWTFGPSHLV